MSKPGNKRKTLQSSLILARDDYPDHHPLLTIPIYVLAAMKKRTRGFREKQKILEGKRWFTMFQRVYNTAKPGKKSASFDRMSKLIFCFGTIAVFVDGENYFERVVSDLSALIFSIALPPSGLLPVFYSTSNRTEGQLFSVKALKKNRFHFLCKSDQMNENSKKMF